MVWDDLDADVCSVARTVEILGDRWTILVLREVFNGVRRFAEIHEHIGVSKSVLAQRLAALTEHGILERHAYQEPGDRVRHEYRLTARGRALHPVLVALMNFGDDQLAGPAGPPVVLRHRDCGAPVTVRLMCANDHEVGLRDVRLEPGPGAQRRSA